MLRKFLHFSWFFKNKIKDSINQFVVQDVGVIWCFENQVFFCGGKLRFFLAYPLVLLLNLVVMLLLDPSFSSSCIWMVVIQLLLLLLDFFLAIVQFFSCCSTFPLLCSSSKFRYLFDLAPICIGWFFLGFYSTPFIVV